MSGQFGCQNPGCIESGQFEVRTGYDYGLIDGPKTRTMLEPIWFCRDCFEHAYPELAKQFTEKA